MIRIIVYDLWMNIKKHGITFICYFVVNFFLQILCLAFSLPQFLSELQTAGQNYNEEIILSFMTSPTMQLYTMVISSISTIVLLWLILKRIPIRLSKPMYVCAAGKKEKMQYLRLHLLVKLGVSLAFTILIQLFMTNSFFISTNWQQNVVQFGLWFFLILVLNLRTDPGNRKEILEAAPDMVTEKSEEIIAGIYWFCLLLIENIVFYTMAIMQVKWSYWISLIWILLFFLNGLLARRCVSPILTYMLSYENIYYPLPEKKE